MDEDYDACDLENWFLALQSADGQVMIPSFHRPGILTAQDWTLQYNSGDTAANQLLETQAMSKILRPRGIDHPNSNGQFPDLLPDLNGKISNYDVDNDGDGSPDSVWLDLGYPARRDNEGHLFKPLFAFMVIGLNGRMPLNTVGNLALRDEMGNNLYQHASHYGYSPSEMDPTYALQSPSPYTSTFNATAGTWGNNFTGYGNPAYFNNGFPFPWYGQIDDATGAAYSPLVPGTVTQAAVAGTPNTYLPNYTGVPVALTQLRSLLTGTRPQPNPITPPINTSGMTPAQVQAAILNYKTTNNYVGDVNAVPWGADPSTGNQIFYLLPNNVADGSDVADGNFTQMNSAGFTDNFNQAVPGRWGEPGLIPGKFSQTNPANPPIGATNGLQPIQTITSFYGQPPNGQTVVAPLYNFSNPVRAGESGFFGYDSSGNYNIVNYEIADDDYDTFDPFPSVATGRIGEVGDADLYDATGSLILPVERARRWGQPADLAGDGQIVTWGTQNTVNGPDQWGRLSFLRYFRPAGMPGIIYQNGLTNPTPPLIAANPGGIAFNFIGGPPPPTGTATFAQDLTNNPTHGFDMFRTPDYSQVPTVLDPRMYGGQMWNIPGQATSVRQATKSPLGAEPTTTPTYSNSLAPYTGPDDRPEVSLISLAAATSGIPLNNANIANGYPYVVYSSPALNHANEMNLYQPNPTDMPFGPADLEWLYRSQDSDGGSLQSRLAQLAPISFTNTVDGQRRRRLFSIDTWDLNRAVWANDNPSSLIASDPAYLVNSPGFTNNAQFSQVGNARKASEASPGAGLGVPIGNGVNPVLGTPALAALGRRVNLHYPLPVSNNPFEPIRQKWISNTYQMLKAILPPKAIDTPQELAQLGQFVVNIIDFRDPDGAVTIWTNPDVNVVPVTTQTGGTPYPYNTTYLIPSNSANFTPPAGVTIVPLVQYGFEYCPLAFNEILAWSSTYKDDTTAPGKPTRISRLFVELSNLLTNPVNVPGPSNTATTMDPTGSHQAIDLSGWQLLILPDDPTGRPDPVTGQPPTLDPTSFGPANMNFTTYSPFIYSPFQVANVVPLQPTGNPVKFPIVDTVATLGTTSQTITKPSGAGATFPQLIPSLNAVQGQNADGSNNAATNTYYYVLGSTLPIDRPTNNPIETYYNGGTQKPTNTPLVALQPPTITATPSGLTTNAAGGTGALQSLVNLPLNYCPASFDPSGGTAPANYPANASIHPLTQSLQANLIYNSKVYTTTAQDWTKPTSAGNVLQPLYFWLYLMRPANPLDPTSPPVAVDSFRFPFADVGGIATSAVNPTTPNQTDTVTASTTSQPIYSAQRLQPFRGGHSVPPFPTPATPVNGYPPYVPTDAYGYSEQTTFEDAYNVNNASPYCIAPTYGTVATQKPQGASAGKPWLYNDAQTNNRWSGATPVPPTPPYPNSIFCTLGNTNDPGNTNLRDNWDYLPFHDRDFTSVTELLMVPGCPPGLFTKQFIEDPYLTVAKNNTPQLTPPNNWNFPYSTPFASATAPRTYPYLVDNFYYTASSEPVAANGLSWQTWPELDGKSRRPSLSSPPNRRPPRRPAPTSAGRGAPAGSRCSNSSRSPVPSSAASARSPRARTSTGCARTSAPACSTST